MHIYVTVRQTRTTQGSEKMKSWSSCKSGFMTCIRTKKEGRTNTTRTLWRTCECCWTRSIRAIQHVVHGWRHSWDLSLTCIMREVGWGRFGSGVRSHGVASRMWPACLVLRWGCYQKTDLQWPHLNSITVVAVMCSTVYIYIERCHKYMQAAMVGSRIHVVFHTVWWWNRPELELLLHLHTRPCFIFLWRLYRMWEWAGYVWNPT